MIATRNTPFVLFVLAALAPCTWPGCPRHGHTSLKLRRASDCDACKAYHHGMGQKTTCEKKGGK